MLLRRLISCSGASNRSQFLASSVYVLKVNRLLTAEPNSKLKWKKNKIQITPRKPLSLSKNPAIITSKAPEDELAEIPPYVDVDPYHSKLVRILTAVKTKRQRYSNNMIMLEGQRLIKEALAAKVEPILILFSFKKLLQGLPLDVRHCQPESTIVHRLHYKHLKTWSSLTTSPGIIGIFRMPNLEKNTRNVKTLPITLVCDNIRDPGNLGSVLRVAASLPVEKVILATGCADLWDPKVIRGSSGAMFFLNIMNNASWDDIYETCNGHVILADHKTQEDIEEKRIKDAVEAENYFEDSETIFDDSKDNELEDDEDDNENENFRKICDLPTKSYSDLVYRKDNSYVLVVGGETHGLSQESFKFANERKGLLVNIPLDSAVDSLNAATALGIISFEIKRQMNSKS